MDSIAELAGISSIVLNSVVVAVQEDPTTAPGAIRARVEQSRKADSVCMMGGWTESQ